jgi:hypothetical protein
MNKKNVKRGHKTYNWSSFSMLRRYFVAPSMLFLKKSAWSASSLAMMFFMYRLVMMFFMYRLTDVTNRFLMNASCSYKWQLLVITRQTNKTGEQRIRFKM